MRQKWNFVIVLSLGLYYDRLYKRNIVYIITVYNGGDNAEKARVLVLVN